MYHEHPYEVSTPDPPLSQKGFHQTIPQFEVEILYKLGGEGGVVTNELSSGALRSEVGLETEVISN